MPGEHRRVPGFLSSLLLTASFLSSAIAQSSLRPVSKNDKDYRFEVATVKPVDANAPGGIMVGTDIDPGGIVKLNGLSLKAMVAEAFNVQYWQIEGGEPWMGKDQYNVVGKPSDEVAHDMPDTRHTLFTINDPRLREMLQNLLAHRFALRVHRSTKPGKVYLLERSATPLALQPNKAIPGEQSASVGTFGSIGFAGHWVLDNTTMSELAQFASGFVLHRPVLDHTGLSGAFDYRSKADEQGTSTANPSDSFLRLLKEIGLKLDPSTGDVETLTIDHAEPPSAN